MRYVIAMLVGISVLPVVLMQAVSMFVAWGIDWVEEVFNPGPPSMTDSEPGVRSAITHVLLIAVIVLLVLR